MGIRIQPHEINIPEEEPFKNDLLERKKSVEVLTHLISSIEGPCVIAVDAAWGAGKTTFLKIWAQHLRNKEFPVVEFNAWETDHSGDPFVALSSELTEGLAQYKEPPLATKIDNTKEMVKELLRKSAPFAIQFALENIPGGKAISQPLASCVKDKLDAHQKARESIGKFKEALQDMAIELSEQKSHPLIVVIDELDRCRPLYAVELLEVAKHLFSVDKIVFVLAVNRAELAHSIKALYGNEFDAEDYLGRFFDLDFWLPEPKREAFIDALLAPESTSSYINGESKRLLQVFLSAPDLSLRQIAQSIHRLQLVLASLNKNRNPFPYTVVVLLILRTIDVNLYYRFCQGDATDLEVSEALSAMLKERSYEVEEARVKFDFTIIIAGSEISDVSHKWQFENSPLYNKFKKTLDESSNTTSDYRHSETVINRFETYGNSIGNIGLRSSFELIELLSPDLIGDSRR